METLRTGERELGPRKASGERNWGKGIGEKDLEGLRVKGLKGRDLQGGLKGRACRGFRGFEGGRKGGVGPSRFSRTLSHP